MSQSNEPAADRVLVLTPFGRDGEMVRDRLLRSGLTCEVCTSIDSLLVSMSASAGAVLIAQEALADGGAETMLTALDHQEPWSDLPVVLLAPATRGARPPARVRLAMFERANITVLERPVSIQLLISTLRGAIRARKRQYQTRDLLQAIELGDMFVSILGHDLRTPLGSIVMGAEAIVRRCEDDFARRTAGRILRATDRMTRIIEQLLDLAWARQPHGMVVDPGPADLREITRPAVEELKSMYPSSRIELLESGDLSGTWDTDFIGRMISNLVGNAVKHGTADGPVTVELDGNRTDAVLIRVTNFGTIPSEAVPTLFEPFKRTKPARTGERGLGLGLYIAQQIAIAHHGAVTLPPTEGEVTVFEVRLPRHSRTGHSVAS